MVNVNESFEVRYKAGKEEFQVLVDFKKLQEFKKNPTQVSVYDVLTDMKVFSNQKKGELASTNRLKAIFDKKSDEEMYKEILTKGECQIPTSYTNGLREEKKKQVINYIVENAINPQMKTRFTPSMIETQVNKIKYSYNPELGHEKQAEEVINHLKKVMPITIEITILEINVPAKFAKALAPKLRAYGHITKEYYDNEGNLRVHLEVIGAGLDKVIIFLKKSTNGEAAYHTQKI